MDSADQFGSLMKFCSDNNLVIDEALDQFEQDWSPSAISLIEEIVAAAPTNGNQELLLELVRADIGRRYAAGLPVNLSTYLERFPNVFADSERAALVCYEDFRARRSRGLACSPDRWAGLQAIASQPWYQELLVTSLDPGELSSVSDFCEAPVSSSSDLQTAGLPTAGSPTGGLPGLDEVAETTDLLRIGDFELIALLGSGAFSRVYLARQLSLGSRFVALKVVNRPFREPAHLARLQHTGIVPLYSCHYADGRWMLCMPYSGPATLADWLKRTAVPMSRSGTSLIETLRMAQNRVTIRTTPTTSATPATEHHGTLDSLRKWHEASSEPLDQLARLDTRQFPLWIFRRLASALAHAHQRGIVHGDLKPANVLIRNDGEPALIDFNLSQSLEDGPRRWAGGTLAYMAPEQLDRLANQTKGSARPQSDVYSLGLLMFEIIEGRLPFAPPATSAEVDLVAASEHRSKSLEFKRAASVDEGVRRIIERCLSCTPEDRYPTGVELLEDLELQAAARPLRYAPESWTGSRIPKLARRYPRFFSAGSVAVVCSLLIAALFVTMSGYRKGAQRLAAVQALKSFDESADRSFSRFLISEAVTGDSSAADRLLPISDALKSLGISGPVESSASYRSDWKQLRTQFTPEENQWVEDRLLALAFIAAQDQRRQSEGRSTAASEAPTWPSHEAVVESILSCLSPEAKQTFAAQISTAITDARLLPTSNADDLASSSVSDSVNPAGDAADRTLLATGRLFQSRPDLALNLLEQTKTPESLNLIYWVTKARAHLELNDSRQAVNSFSMVLQHRESAAAIYLNRGLAHLRHSALQEALQDFSDSIKRDPTLVAAYVNRHAVWLALGKVDSAIQDLDHAILLSPESPRLRLIRSRVLRQQGQLKAAQEDFSLAMKQRPTTADDWVSVALARLPDDPGRSLSDLETAETLYGGNSTILQSMAHVLSEYLHRPDDAVLALDRLLAKTPEFQKALAGRAVLLARAGKTELVESDVERLSSLPVPPTAESLYQMACALALCSADHPKLTRQALLFLADAVDRGYGGHLLLTDPDLESLRKNPEFEIIVKHFELATAYRK